MTWLYLQKSGGTMPNTLVLSHSSRAMAMVNQPVLSQELELLLNDKARSPFLFIFHETKWDKFIILDFTSSIISLEINTDESKRTDWSLFSLPCKQQRKNPWVRHSFWHWSSLHGGWSDWILYSNAKSSYLPVGLLFTCKWVYEWLDWSNIFMYLVPLCKLIFSQPFSCSTGAPQRKSSMVCQFSLYILYVGDICSVCSTLSTEISLTMEAYHAKVRIRLSFKM